MKALNRKEVFTSYLNFTKYMIFLVTIALVCVFFFFKTASTEIDKIQLLGAESQRIFDQQLSLSDDFDYIFQTYQSLDLVEENNTPFLMSSIANKKMKINTAVQKVPKKDVYVHKHLVDQMDKLLRTRDSINALKLTENVYKNDVIRCTEENKVITRKVKVGKLSYDKK
ncbi:type VI secretion system TssO [Capnocytophaga cynodegmi]|uniref:type VI secretion system TssO n=1 Tax=Capnocytophaga cynodegmi TaxID=28189 RepID=UPI00385952E7